MLVHHSSRIHSICRKECYQYTLQFPPAISFCDHISTSLEVLGTNESVERYQDEVVSRLNT